MITFQLDPQSGVPFYRQIVDQIRFGIATDKLVVGDQLPTVRGLAVELRINLNTVSRAYKELEIQKILYTQQGTGTFVAAIKIDLPESERVAKLAEITTSLMNAAAAYGFTASDIIEKLEQTRESNT